MSVIRCRQFPSLEANGRTTLSSLVVGLCLVFCTLTGAHAEDPTGLSDQVRLHDLRLARRLAVRQHSLEAAKSAGSAHFSLLVIPVDFTDARLSSAWEPTALAPRLQLNEGESLRNYFRIASIGRLELHVVMAPLVRLPDTRREYSDVGYAGFTRTRRLATDAIAATAAAGFPLRLADNDGLDGLAGTADDDGSVDGVLILHAGIGRENDPEDGLIEPLQFFLEEPVIAGGISASSYAVASLKSGPGIWAHETAHLLGLEDRYDPLLPTGGSEVASRGGLGRFSLMGSGAWGTGDGYGAALPDAYSLAELGWVPVRRIGFTGETGETLRAPCRGGAAHRIWTRSEAGPEFFLLETRDPESAAPFDAGLPGGQVLIYHVDETIPEGRWRDDPDGGYHLRVRLVEADADDALRSGIDDGTASDPFPGTLGRTAFGSVTSPSSRGYDGPSEVEVSRIASGDSTASYHAVVSETPAVTLTLQIVGVLEPQVAIAVSAVGSPLTAPTADIELIGDEAWGSFAGGADLVSAPLIADPDGEWRPESGMSWEPAANVPVDACTEFRITIRDAGRVVTAENRIWCWRAGDSLDFTTVWPGAWRIEHPDGDTGTTWIRWDTVPWNEGDGGAVLVCTGATYTSAVDWPEITYTNRALATLTSGELGPAVTGVRLIHAMDAEMLTPGTGIDGGVAVWIAPDGTEISAEPLGGWDGGLYSKALHVLHGQDGFVGNAALNDPDAGPVWRCDVLPLPAGAGPGPWSLRLTFAADTLWRGRGWLVGGISVLETDPAAADIGARWDGGFAWDWPLPTSGDPVFELQVRDQDAESWSTVVSRSFERPLTGLRFTTDEIRVALGGASAARRELRVTGTSDLGTVASRPVAFYGDGGAQPRIAFDQPWPNPATGGLRFAVRVEDGAAAGLRIYDVRGRLVHVRDYPAGDWLGIWDGHDTHGRRLPSGTYYLRLEGTGRTVTHKVVLLH